MSEKCVVNEEETIATLTTAIFTLRLFLALKKKISEMSVDKMRKKV